MANVFNSVKGLHPKRNAFSSHTYRNDFTGKLGVNIPIYQQHVTAATRVKLGTSALIRLQALFAPVMDNIDFYVHFWQIPYRLLENDRFTAFISGEVNAEDYELLFFKPSTLASSWLRYSSSFEDIDERISAYNATFKEGSILDFLGYDSKLFPDISYNSDDDEFVLTGGNNSTIFNARPLIAYYLLHLHWYMNENVPYWELDVTGFFGEDGDFVSLVNLIVKDFNFNALLALLINSYHYFSTTILPHGWEKDYFTSALPNVQYGDPVTIGVGGIAPLTTPDGAVQLDVVPEQTSIAKDMVLALHQTGQQIDLVKYQIRNNSSDLYDVGWLEQGRTSESDPDSNVNRKAAGSILSTTVNGTRLLVDLSDDTLQGVYADLSNASAITINELRFANALQVFKEREQRFGRRRLEYYKGFFDVTPEDLRLQVPRYLGGGRIPINIADIEQTSSSTETQALGRLAGKATAVAGGFAGFSTFCSEETIIIGIGFAMPHITYANSVSKFLLKTNDKYDYFNPSFEHLGEQAIKNIEVFSGATVPDGDFGYTPRFTEYRFHANEMHGQFKSTLSYWSLGRIFDSQPALNADFIYMQPKVFDRIFAVEGQDNLIASMIFNVRLIQPVSKYGTPRIMV